MVCDLRFGALVLRWDEVWCLGTCVASLWSSCSRGQHACLPAGRPAWDRGHGGPGRPPGWEGDQSLLGTFASGDTARYGWGPRTWSMRPVPASLTTPRPALSDSGPTHSLLPGSSPHSFAWLASHPLAPGLPGPPNQEACLPYSPSRFPLFPLHGTCHNLFCHTCWFTCFLAVSPLDCVPMSGTGEGLRNYLLKEWSYVTLSAILGVVTILAACCRSGNRCLEAESSAHGHPCGMWQSWPLGPCLPGGPQIMLEATPPRCHPGSCAGDVLTPRTGPSPSIRHGDTEQTESPLFLCALIHQSSVPRQTPRASNTLQTAALQLTCPTGRGAVASLLGGHDSHRLHFRESATGRREPAGFSPGDSPGHLLSPSSYGRVA